MYRNTKLIAIRVGIITVSFTLMLIFNSAFAFHQNLGIDDNKASELYHSNPNDPAIFQWKNALQSAISEMDKCFDIQTAISCQSLIETIVSNCNSHPNTLLGCNDNRLPEYPSILKQAQEAQKKAEEEQRKTAIAQAEEAKRSRPIRIQAYGADMLNKCFLNSNTSSNFEVANPACDLEMRSLQSECQLANNTLDYCKDERFVGYLSQHNIMNSTSLTSH